MLGEGGGGLRFFSKLHTKLFLLAPLIRDVYFVGCSNYHGWVHPFQSFPPYNMALSEKDTALDEVWLSLCFYYSFHRYTDRRIKSIIQLNKKESMKICLFKAPGTLNWAGSLKLPQFHSHHISNHRYIFPLSSRNVLPSPNWWTNEHLIRQAGKIELFLYL